MDSYAPLLEKTRLPQPSLQKFAVISIFSKLRSAPNYLDPESDPGKRAISRCLSSASPNVVDQSVRELCRLVTDSVIAVNRGLLELQSALEGSDPRFVPVFVKGLGFLVRYGFQKSNASWRFSSTEAHPFVKVLACRLEVQHELMQQVLLFMLQNKQLGMVEVCKFLRPLLNFSIIRFLVSESSSSSFAMQLVSSMASFCCSFPHESILVFKMLVGCLKYLPHETSEDYRRFVFIIEHVVEAYIVVLKSSAGKKSLITEAQHSAVEFLETIVSLYTCVQWHPGGHEPMFELARHLLSVQKDLGLQWVSGLSSTMASLFTIFVESELEHEQISLLKLLLLILKWKYDGDDASSSTKSSPVEEILFILPAVSLMSSPSKSVKGLATDLVVILEKLLIKMFVAPIDKPIIGKGIYCLSTPGIIVSRLLQHLWYQDGESSRISLLKWAVNGTNESEIMHDRPLSWVSHVQGFCLSILDRRKSSLPLTHFQEVFLTEIPSLLSAVVGILLIHPSMGAAAVDALSSIAIIDPKLGVPLLLTIMFYSNIFTRKDAASHAMLLKILEMLPSLASHSAMIPLVVQTILPMLKKDAKVSLYATATRLLCRTWEINDRTFASLQGVLLPKGFTDFMSERAICISMAASIRDVCHKNPDRGVDLILSVSSCIENQNPVIKALGLQGLACLCEADVIDFYTAWDVIAKHVQGYHDDRILAHSICLLLRWGAMDAEAYPEASKGVVQILWGVVTSRQETQWAKARVSALEALTQYEVSQVEKSIADFKKRTLELLFSETNPEVLKAMEDFQVKMITYEHINRRRLVKEKRITGSKIEKLMDVLPRVIFSSGKISEARELPGAALFCFSFTAKVASVYQASKTQILRDVHAGYGNALAEIAASLQLSRNILLALMALQSWKAFVRRWMKAYTLSYDTKAQSVLDKTSKAASDILKSMISLADEAIPRAAENIALAIGALCVVLPPSVHTVKSAASKFLLEWLLQHEHEHRQWSAAISIGLISSCLHVTDHKQRYNNITRLLEVLYSSKSSLVKGACGVGLGFSCQDLLTRVETADDSTVEKETNMVPEYELLGRIVRTLATMIHKRTQFSSVVLDSLCSCFPPGSYEVNAEVFDPSSENSEDLEEDIWDVAGLVLGLATSISAVYRAGELEAVLKIKSLVISWLPYVNSVQSTSFHGKESEIVLALGSCLALPTIVSFCQRMELMDDIELNHIVVGFKEFISDLISVKKSGILHQSLLMASCVGAGTVVSCILNEGVHPIEVECVKGLLELFRKCYSNPYPFLVHLGGMLGVVNAMGAGTGILVYMNFLNQTKQSDYQKKGSSSVMGPLLSSSVVEPYLTSLVQEIFLVAQNSDGHQLQQFASWVLSFLRHNLWSKELLGVDSDKNVAETTTKSTSQSFSEDNVVMKLSLWLMDFNYTEPSNIAHVGTVVTVLRCLSRAPRLPSLDWGAIIKRCMRYEAKVAELLPPDSTFKMGSLRGQCIQFALAHANQFDSLLTFLDELSDFSRFRTLEITLQSCLLINLADLVKVFSSSRLEKLFGDVINYLSSFISYEDSGTYQKSLFRISCWKGLYECLDEVSVDTCGHISLVERCMEVLFMLLPLMQSSGGVVSGDVSSVEEWSEAVRCLGKARQSWLLDFLKVSHEEFVHGADESIEMQKKVRTKIKLVKSRSLPLVELRKMKSYILNSKFQGLWDVLIEVVAALHHADGSVRRQWLIDAVEISCVSSFPSTALQFLGLLSATCCKYMPFMIVDQQMVLSDLPVTLASLLADRSWNAAAETVVSHLFSSTERIYNWAIQIADGSYIPGSQPIDESENHMADFLLQVMHRTCVLLKGHLPLEKQLRLAGMVIS